jgi:hypothetical protein
MINSVRNTVLSVLNKNNYGYISPSDFNLYAKQAQMEFFDEYFSSYNKNINMENSRLSGTDYAHIIGNIAETIESFTVSDFLVPVITPAGNILNQFYTPSLVTVGNDMYMANSMTCYTKLLTSGVNDFVIPFELSDNATGNFIIAGVKPGDIVLNATTYKSSTVVQVISDYELTLNDDIFQDPATGEEYRIYSASTYSQADKVSNGKIAMLNGNAFTNPSTVFPAYVQEGEIIRAYPTSISGYGAVNLTYYRFPKAPKWTYITLSGGEPVFDQTQPDYQDFELPQEDEYKLVVKILQYCGISIREAEVTQFGMAQEQHEQPTFSQKQ